VAERDGLQLGQPLAAAGAAEEDRQLVAYEFAAAAGENRRPVGEARAVLLADAGGERTDPAVVWGDGAKDCRLAGGNWLERGCWRSKSQPKSGRDGEVCMEVAEKPGFGDFDVFGRGRKVTLSRRRGASAQKNATRGLDWMVVGV
jgi:hypothetical protein